MVKKFDHSDIKKAVVKSQHCQRNWDLSRELPEEDIDLMVHAVQNCPSKQNSAFYNAYFVTDRDVIEKIHSQTDGFGIAKDKTITNSQTLANLVVVFTENKDSERVAGKMSREHFRETPEAVRRDTQMATGIAAGYLNVIGTMMGYETGCCACFNHDGIAEALGVNETPMLIMGIGYKDPNRPRREHHAMEDTVFPTNKKEPISVTRL